MRRNRHQNTFDQRINRSGPPRDGGRFVISRCCCYLVRPTDDGPDPSQKKVLPVCVCVYIYIPKDCANVFVAVNSVNNTAGNYFSYFYVSQNTNNPYEFTYPLLKLISWICLNIFFFWTQFPEWKVGDILEKRFSNSSFRQPARTHHSENCCC